MTVNEPIFTKVTTVPHVYVTSSIIHSKTWTNVFPYCSRVRVRVRAPVLLSYSKREQLGKRWGPILLQTAVTARVDSRRRSGNNFPMKWHERFLINFIANHGKTKKKNRSVWNIFDNRNTPCEWRGHSSCKITVKNLCHDVYLSWSPCELNETLHLRSATSLSQSWVIYEVDVFKTTWVPEERGTPVPRTATVLSSYVHTRLGRTVHKSITDNTFLQLFTQLQLLNKYYFQVITRRITSPRRQWGMQACSLAYTHTTE